MRNTADVIGGKPTAIQTAIAVYLFILIHQKVPQNIPRDGHNLQKITRTHADVTGGKPIAAILL
jgi:hypothetical protein